MTPLHKTAIILAAGLGTRMKSRHPKVTHRIAGLPMLSHLINSLTPLYDRIVVVTGPDMPAITALAAPHPSLIQTERLGTAHAARAAEAQFGDGIVSIIYGDNPLLTAPIFQALIDAVSGPDAAGLALIGAHPPNPGAFGRIITEHGTAQRIIESADATEAEKAITLCNIGGFTGHAAALRTWLRSIDNHNAKAEYYLTDLVARARADGQTVRVIEAPWEQCLGVNSRAELAAAEAALQTRLRAAALAAGVTMTAPDTVFLAADTILAPDVTIEPNVMFGPGVRLAPDVTIRAFSYLEGCTIEPGAIIGPFARIRPGSLIGEGAHVGNFCEVKATHLGSKAKVNHLSYLGDASIGARTNIGAGTITCNYDGSAKHRTTIGADAFIGSDVALVAPVTVGDGAIIGAGSIITENVAADALALARARQVQKPGRARTLRQRHKQPKDQ